jgi:hypothetical protein
MVTPFRDAPFILDRRRAILDLFQHSQDRDLPADLSCQTRPDIPAIPTFSRI